MTYNEVKQFMSEVSKKGNVLGLEAISDMIDRLSIPWEKQNIIHVAGTNGKGSTSSYLASILAHANYRVGRYSSPAVFDELETISITSWDKERESGGQLLVRNISEEEYASTLNSIKEVYEQMKQEGVPTPTAFEVETVLALLYLSQSECDYIILEVGMGGRLDATNVVRQKLCSVFTSISLDHTQFLGDTLEKIAYEKAGIITEQEIVITTNQSEEVLAVIQEECKKKQVGCIISDSRDGRRVQLSQYGECFEYKGTQYEVSLMGIHQIQNSILAIDTVNALVQAGKTKVSQTDIKLGLKNAKWQGRLEKIQDNPTVIIDGAHNEGAAIVLAKTMEQAFPNKRIILLVGMFGDKDYNSVLRNILPLSRDVITVTTHTERALNSTDLAKAVIETYKELGLESYHVYDEDRITDGINKAIQIANKDDVILAFGSLSYLRDVKARFNK